MDAGNPGLGHPASSYQPATPGGGAMPPGRRARCGPTPRRPARHHAGSARAPARALRSGGPEGLVRSGASGWVPARPSTRAVRGRSPRGRGCGRVEGAGLEVTAGCGSVAGGSAAQAPRRMNTAAAPPRRRRPTGSRPWLLMTSRTLERGQWRRVDPRRARPTPTAPAARVSTRRPRAQGPARRRRARRSRSGPPRDAPAGPP